MDSSRSPIALTEDDMSRVKSFVPDANIFLSYIVDKDDSSEMARVFSHDLLMGTIACVVPSIWAYEICNRLSRLRDEDFEESQSLFNTFRRFFTIQELNNDLIATAYGITVRHPVSFYDATYHALALLNQGTFITLDKKYYEQTKKLKHILLLKDYT